jgi:hypothetical protein
MLQQTQKDRVNNYKKVLTVYVYIYIYIYITLPYVLFSHIQLLFCGVQKTPQNKSVIMNIIYTQFK